MEIEAKIKVNNALRYNVVSVVVALGGQHRYDRHEVNVFYDTKQNKLNGNGEVLRLRRELYVTGEDLVSMTYKGRLKKGKMKMRPEHEFSVGDFDQAQLLLNALGYKETFRFEKKRTSYHLNECLVEFDTLPHLDDFIEVEGQTEKKIAKLLKQLGLKNYPIITDGYPKLLIDDAQKNKRNKKSVVFTDFSVLP